MAAVDIQIRGNKPENTQTTDAGMEVPLSRTKPMEKLVHDQRYGAKSESSSSMLGFVARFLT